MTPHDITREARKWLGIKFAYQGRTRERGVDCVGILYGVAYGVGLTPEPFSNYSHTPDPVILIENLQKYCDEISFVRDMRPGDILVCSGAGETPRHTMILTTDMTVIHASAQHRKVVEHRLDEKTLNGIARVFRFKGMTYGE